MIFNGHVPVVPYHIDRIFFNLPRGKIPVTWITDMGFLDLFPIDKKFPVTKLNVLIFLSDHTF